MSKRQPIEVRSGPAELRPGPKRLVPIRCVESTQWMGWPDQASAEAPPRTEPRA
jgi:hypothetical protein